MPSTRPTTNPLPCPSGDKPATQGTCTAHPPTPANDSQKLDAPSLPRMNSSLRERVATTQDKSLSTYAELRISSSGGHASPEVPDAHAVPSGTYSGVAGSTGIGSWRGRGGRMGNFTGMPAAAATTPSHLMTNGALNAIELALRRWIASSDQHRGDTHSRESAPSPESAVHAALLELQGTHRPPSASSAATHTPATSATHGAHTGLPPTPTMVLSGHPGVKHGDPGIAEATQKLLRAVKASAGPEAAAEKLLEGLLCSLCTVYARSHESTHSTPLASPGLKVPMTPATPAASPAFWRAQAATVRLNSRRIAAATTAKPPAGRRASSHSPEPALATTVASPPVVQPAADSPPREADAVKADDTPDYTLEQPVVPQSPAGAASEAGSHTSLLSLILAAPQTTQHATVGQELEDGTSDLNQYVMLESIGRGKQGEVFLAMDTDKSELRAVKVVRRPRPRAGPALTEYSNPSSGTALGSALMAGGGIAVARDRQRQQLEREIAIMKKCRHRNIVALYEVIDDPDLDVMYIVMQYVEHGPLRSLDFAGTLGDPVGPCKLASYARQLCAGLEYLHRHGVVHRDIKPDNILLGPDDQVYLADFGMADTFECTEEHNGNGRGTHLHPVRGTRGTLAFMAPELLDPMTSATTDGEQVDVWALGVTLYVLLYGRMPWPVADRTAADMTEDVMHLEISFPSVAPPRRAWSSNPHSGVDTEDEVPTTSKTATTASFSAATPNTATSDPADLSRRFSEDSFAPMTSQTRRAATRSTTTWPGILKRMLERDPVKRATVREIRRSVVLLDSTLNSDRKPAVVDADEADVAEAITLLRRGSTVRVLSR